MKRLIRLIWVKYTLSASIESYNADEQQQYSFAYTRSYKITYLTQRSEITQEKRKNKQHLPIKYIYVPQTYKNK